MGIAGSIEPFNNEKWVQENIAHLNPKNANETFRYVILHHPLHGCTVLGRDEQVKRHFATASLEEISRYADAVTVACYRSLPPLRIADLIDTIHFSNWTGIANVAYLGMNRVHDRQEAEAVLRAWRQVHCH